MNPFYRIFLLLSVLLLTACERPELQLDVDGAWDPLVRKSLNALMHNHKDKGNYAVFDFDKTSIVHDVSQALWVYQVENLRYADAPAHAFLDGIPDTGRMIDGISFAEMGATLQEDYSKLATMRAEGKTLEEIHSTPEYLDFRARMLTLLLDMDDEFGYDVSYLWMPGLLAGYTEDEARSVVRDAIAAELGRDRLLVEEWVSPDGNWGGACERGIWFPPEMKQLYGCLSDNGITPYVCSASLELIVEVLACDSELGVGLPPERVFGLRFVPGEIMEAVYDSAYVQPIREGKVSCIEKWMAPQHGGRGPVLVCGDSNGDVAMLSSFPDMVYGLIIDVGRSPESAIGKLATQAREHPGERYLLQPAFATAAGSMDGGGI